MNRKTKLYNWAEMKSVRRVLRKSLPKGEVLLWQKLKNKQLGVKFRRQYSNGRYVIDFFCTELCFGIEVDGLSHEENIDCDRKRQHWLESRGITIIRFTSEEIFRDLDQVVENIYSHCSVIEGK